MSLAVVRTRSLEGVTAPEVLVEVHLANGLPSLTLVGLAETEVKEARERVRAALHSAGLQFPHNQRITVNLAPADVPKESGRFDLPIAVGILAATGQMDAAALERHEFAGELSLAGGLRPVRGALAMALALRREASPRGLVLPMDSAREAAWVGNVPTFGASHLLDLVAAFPPTGDGAPLPRAQPAAAAMATSGADLRDVRGQAAAKRVLEIAASGAHSLLMVGPPGSGKSMLAQRFIDLLPPLDDDEALESAAVLSLARAFDPARWSRRVFRAPHHSASQAALVGGGSPPRPGEISLAHCGVLFLDELPEFGRQALEALREPLENGSVVIARAARRAEFPARFQLLAAMNPCPCGHLGDPLRACRCSPDAVSRYQGRLSGPLLDRLDLQVEVPSLPPSVLAAAPDGEPSDVVAARVAAARRRAIDRQGRLNAQLQGAALDQHAALDEPAARLLEAASRRLAWSGRGYHRVLRVARTIADLEAAPRIAVAHVAEAIQYRRAAGAGG